MNDQERSNLVRRWIDGETTVEETASLEQLRADDPTVEAQIAFERHLRDRVKETFGRSTAPAGLADRVRQTLAEADGEPAVIGGIEAEPVSLWRRSNFLAIAATLAIVAGAVLLGIFGPQIDDRGAEGEFIAAARHASEEHRRCADSPSARASKVGRITDAEEASRRLGEHLSAEVEIYDFSEFGFEFCGAGFCQLPGADRSGHIVYTRSDPPAMLSLFIAPDNGQYDIEVASGLKSGSWYPSDGGPRCRHQVLRTTDDNLVYFLVCCDEDRLVELTRSMNQQLRSR